MNDEQLTWSEQGLRAARRSGVAPQEVIDVVHAVRGFKEWMGDLMLFVVGEAEPSRAITVLLTREDDSFVLKIVDVRLSNLAEINELDRRHPRGK